MATLEQRVLTFLQRWQITAFMLASVLMQALLLLTGKTRRWDPAWRHVAWVAFNASSYVGSAALGALAQQAVAAVLSGGGPGAAAIYAIWAPLLLLHLGGPDNVSAFDAADAELWPREGLTMALRLLTALYVVATCARGGAPVLVSSILLLLVGAFKYVEHIQALRLASRDAIVASTLPIYYYMLWEPTIQPQYDSDDVRGRRPRFYYIISGDKKWYEVYLKEKDFAKARRRSPLVTLDDILTCPLLARFTRSPLQAQVKQPASSVLQNPPLGLLCFGFALHKMYKRRLSHLFMYEWRNPKIKELFLGAGTVDLLRDEQDILRLLEIELNFLYDGLYTNAAGTAYSKQGVFVRAASAVFISVAGGYIFKSIHFSVEQVSNARLITFLLFSAALGVEFYQLLRLVFSDWTRVWLASTCVKLHRAAESNSNSSSPWCVKAAAQASIAALQSAVLLWLWVSGQTPRLSGLWIKRIEVGQYTMLWSDVERELLLAAATTSHSNQSTAISSGRCRSSSFDVIHGHKRKMPVLRGARAQETKTYVIRKIVERCREIWRSSPGAMLQPLSGPFWFAQEYMQKGRSYDAVLKALVGWRPGDTLYYMDLEHLVVTWHLATCLCEQLLVAELRGIGTSSLRVVRLPPTLLQVVSMASRLSRYATYLLVQKTELLPCHPDISRQLARNTELKLHQVIATTPPIQEPSIVKEPSNSLILEKVLVIVEDEEKKVEDFNELVNAIKVTRLLQHELLDLVDRWQFIGDVWIDLIMHMAYDNKSSEHLQQLTKGEELLTQLWVLLGHVGYGKQ